MKRICLSLGLLALGATALVPVWAAAPAKVSDVATIEEIVAEIKERATKLNESTANDEAFKRALEEKSIGRDAGVLAVVAQALVEHDKGKDVGIAGATLREAALALRKTKSFDEAKAAVTKAQGALTGKADPAAMADHPWNKLTGMHAMMDEIEAKQQKLRRALAKPRDLPKSSQHAAVIALLSLAMEEDTHEVKKPEEIPQWKALAKEYRDTLSKVAVGMRANKAEDASAAFNGSARTCTVCHEKFRD